jgi:hypothetical protein
MRSEIGEMYSTDKNVRKVKKWRQKIQWRTLENNIKTKLKKIGCGGWE